MTYEDYRTQPKSRLQWKPVAKIDTNPEFVSLFNIHHICCSHPIFRE